MAGFDDSSAFDLDIGFCAHAIVLPVTSTFTISSDIFTKDGWPRRST
jgi:hypothetical protein